MQENKAKLKVDIFGKIRLRDNGEGGACFLWVKFVLRAIRVTFIFEYVVHDQGKDKGGHILF